MVLEYLCFWPSRRCSAGSKIFFCDKQSEICQKKFSPPANSELLRKNMKIQKSHNSVYISHIMPYIGGILHGFRVSVFLTQQKVLCGIQDIFLWQTIWDLSKKIFSSSKLPALVKNTQIQNLMILCISLPLCFLLVIFYRFFSICVYNPHKVLCEIQDIFLGQTIWDLSNKISAPANSQLLWKTHKSENLIFCPYPSHYVSY